MKIKGWPLLWHTCTSMQKVSRDAVEAIFANFSNTSVEMNQEYPAQATWSLTRKWSV